MKVPILVAAAILALAGCMAPAPEPAGPPPGGEEERPTAPRGPSGGAGGLDDLVEKTQEEDAPPDGAPAAPEGGPPPEEGDREGAAEEGTPPEEPPAAETPPAEEPPAEEPPEADRPEPPERDGPHGGPGAKTANFRTFADRGRLLDEYALGGIEALALRIETKRPIEEAEAEFEIRNDGEREATVLFQIRDATGKAVAERRVTLEPGESAEEEIGHEFHEDTPGAAGRYEARAKASGPGLVLEEMELDLDRA